MNEKFLKLTNTVYKVLEFFPESDPLKNRAKDRALSVMEGLVLLTEVDGWISFQKEKTRVQVLEDIDVLLGYLWIAKSQGWLNSVNCLIISNEYEKVKREIGPARELTQKLPGLNEQEPKQDLLEDEEVESTPHEITERQRKILEFLSQNEKAQVSDLKTILPDITKRTIRRDLDELLGGGKVVRMGDFNQVLYKLVS